MRDGDFEGDLRMTTTSAREANEPAWTCSLGSEEPATEPDVAPALPTAHRDGVPPRPRQGRRMTAALVAALLLAAGAGARLLQLESGARRAEQILQEHSRAIASAKDQAAERERRLRELESEFDLTRQELAGRTNELQDSQAKAAQLESQLQTELDEARQEGERLADKLASQSVELETAQKQVLRRALERAELQGCQQRLAELELTGSKAGAARASKRQ